MRNATMNVNILEEKDQVIGLSFGSDFCAEHEWGIKRIQKSFKISGDLQDIGTDRYKVCEVPPDLLWKDNKGVSGMIFTQGMGDYTEPGEGSLRLYGEKELVAAWDEESFGFCCKSSDKETKEKIREVYEALKNKDAVILLCGGGNNPFARAGLSIFILSRLPEAVKKDWESSHKTANEIHKLWRKRTQGLYKSLAEAGKGWFFLGGENGPGGLTRDEDGTLTAWLNPRDQKNNNSGWFTPEELKAWAKNEGPIPKR